MAQVVCVLGGGRGLVCVFGGGGRGGGGDCLIDV